MKQVKAQMKQVRFRDFRVLPSVQSDIPSEEPMVADRMKPASFKGPPQKCFPFGILTSPIRDLLNSPEIFVPLLNCMYS